MLNRDTLVEIFSQEFHKDKTNLQLVDYTEKHLLGQQIELVGRVTEIGTSTYSSVSTILGDTIYLKIDGVREIGGQELGTAQRSGSLYQLSVLVDYDPAQLKEVLLEISKDDYVKVCGKLQNVHYSYSSSFISVQAESLSKTSKPVYASNQLKSDCFIVPQLSAQAYTPTCILSVIGEILF